MLLPRLSGVVAAAWLSMATVGCAALAGDQEMETKFRVDPRVDGTFFGWSEITIDEDPNSVDGASIGWVTLRVQDPPNADLRFLDYVIGEAVTPDGRTRLVEQRSFPEGEPEVPLKVVHRGDIRGFFSKDKHTIRIEWTGATNPSFKNWPEDGFELKVTASIKIDD